MDSAQARSLIREMFTQPFEKGRFQHFVRNLLNHIDDSKAKHWNRTYVKDAFKPRINRFERLATYTAPSGEKLDILIVHLERESSLERARTSLRNFVADYLSTRGGKEAALVAFVSPRDADWRFSFVKMEYETAADDTGKVKVTEKLSPARRCSFLVGANEHSHTAQKQFLPLLEKDDGDPALVEIETAFDIETVTREFFRQYKSLFEMARDALREILRQRKVVKNHFDEKGIDADDFAKKLLGQIVFLYFLQKKGWFGVNRGAAWGTGNKHFIRYLFEHRAKFQVANERSPNRAVNFFNDILEPLFHNTLATERANDYADRFDCRIPFLNGGLFEPLFGYDWVNIEILLPDRLFSNDEVTNGGDTGTGILDVFDRFNFTVSEAEPLEKDVAVDPEMLGKVFENLLPENIRHKGGTYYTPRVIVNYMCQQSLINYLSNHLPELPRKDIENFLRIGYVQAEFEAAGTRKHEDKFLPDLIRTNARAIDKLLEEIFVCDPAIGSGAFPVGMMQEIVRARETLAAIGGMPERSSYELKRHAIQNSLYGVDIDPGAVEIAKLRLWLSLVVDEEDRDRIQALPNLDYKIMQGNSLLEEFSGVKLLDEDFIDKNKGLDTEALEALKAQIASMRQEAIELRRTHGTRSSQAIKHEEKIDKLLRELGTLIAQPGKQNEDLFISESSQRLTLLKERHREFFGETSAGKKERLRSEIEVLEWEFMEAKLTEDGEDEALMELRRHRRDNRRNYFLWALHFVEVFEKSGGFDVVIGNPPYVDSENMVRENPAEREAIQRNYQTTRGNWDLYIPFWERSLKISNPRGIATLITPNKWLAIPYGKALRDYSSSFIQSLADYSHFRVFENTGVFPVVVLMNKARRDQLTLRTFNDANEIINESFLPFDFLRRFENWGMLLSPNLDIIVKMSSHGSKLSTVCDLESAFTVSEAYEVVSLIREHRKTSEAFFKFINTGTIDPYVSLWGLKPTTYLKRRYQEPVLGRREFKRLFSRRFDQSSSPKIVISGMRHFEAFLDLGGDYVAGKSTVILRNLKQGTGWKFLLALLNSRLASFFLKQCYGV